MAKAGSHSLTRDPPADIAERLYAAGADLTPGGAWRLEDLARDADVPRATLYYYFPGRDAVMDWLTRQALKRHVDLVVSEPPGSYARVAAMLAAIGAALAAHPAMTVRFMAALSANTASEEVLLEADRRLIAPLRAALHEALAEGHLRLGAREADVALGLFCALASVIVVRAHAGETGGLDLPVQALARQLLNGLDAPA